MYDAQSVAQKTQRCSLERAKTFWKLLQRTYSWNVTEVIRKAQISKAYWVWPS